MLVCADIAATKYRPHHEIAGFLTSSHLAHTTRPCAKQALLADTNCAAHAPNLPQAATYGPQRYGDASRKVSPMAIDRIRGRALQTLRKRLLSANPLCVACQARKPPVVSAATQLDHIKAIVNGGDARPDDDGYQGLCDSCHSTKSRADMGYKPRAQFDRSGRVVW